MTVTTNTGDEASVRAAMGADVLPVEEQKADDDGRPAAREADGGTDGRPDADADPAPRATPEPSQRAAKPRDNPQARIAQEIERRKAAEARAADAEARLTAQQTAKPADVKPAPAATRVKPTEAEVGTKYPTYAEFIDDLIEWNADQRAAAQKPADIDKLVEEKLAAREAQRSHETRWAAHRDRIAVVHARHPELQAAIDAADLFLTEAGLQLSAAASEAIVTSDRSGDLVEWLATHPTDYLQLARDTQSLDVAAVPLVRQLLEARLGAVAVSGSAPVARISSAKPPIKPVGASPSTASPDDGSDDEAFDRFFSRENAKDRKAGRL